MSTTDEGVSLTRSDTPVTRVDDDDDLDDERLLDECNCDEAMEYRGLLECLSEFGINQTITLTSLLDTMKNNKKPTKFIEGCMKSLHGKPTIIIVATKRIRTIVTI
jgi:hypothetical protein